jgi:hypothetical protein
MSVSMKGIRVDPASWRVAVCVAASLMTGVLLAVGSRAMDAAAGRTLHTGLMFWLCTVAGLALGYVAAALACPSGEGCGCAVSEQRASTMRRIRWAMASGV